MRKLLATVVTVLAVSAGVMSTVAPPVAEPGSTDTLAKRKKGPGSGSDEPKEPGGLGCTIMGDVALGYWVVINCPPY